MHSLRVLLTGILDYAGLFPPAKLEMTPTVRNFGAYMASGESWMLGRLVIPVARLEEFERAASTLLPPNDEDDVWLVTALTAPAGDPAFEKDLETILAFNDRHLAADQGAAYIDALEVKATRADAIDAAVGLVPDEIQPYFELPLDGDFRGLIAAIAGQDAGAKVRTGGLTPDAVPSAERLAEFIAACAAAQVPFKATAGLHHPLRHTDKATGSPMHGFLNVFGAACAAWCERLGAEGIRELLLIERPNAFVFDDEGMTVGGIRLSTEQVEEGREQFAHSFGSCSFTEPLEDLRTLNLLDKA